MCDKIYNYIRKKEIFYKNENIMINIPHNNDELAKYYTMFPDRDNCEVLFRLLIKYLYENSFLDKNKNIIDLG
jgi:hypothetical protein